MVQISCTHRSSCTKNVMKLLQKSFKGPIFLILQSSKLKNSKHFPNMRNILVWSLNVAGKLIVMKSLFSLVYL